MSSRISVDRTDISIHSLRMEGDQEYQKLVQLDQQFQSTPSAWRETLLRLRHAEPDQLISIHSLRMEGDNAMAHLSMQYMRFQSTPSAWRETEFTLHGKEYEGISIHSLRMEGDRC